MEFSGIEKVSLVDYDNKISCVLFTESCNFRCPYCHNSSLVLNEVDSFIPFENILDYLKKRRNVLDAVVISGGEPTLHPDLVDKIKSIKELGYLVKLDTNGTNYIMLEELVNNKLIDYVAMDIKNSFSMYASTIGLKSFNIETVRKSICFLKNNVIHYEFRTTLVNEFHSEKSIIEMGEMLKGADKLFLQKFIDSKDCIKRNLHEVSLIDAKKYQEILSKYIKNVKLRGYE